MAVSHPNSPESLRTEIARLEWANAMMRAANKALARDDRVALADIGFSPEHVEDLQKHGGFRSSSIGQNTRMINSLRALGSQHAR